MSSVAPLPLLQQRPKGANRYGAAPFTAEPFLAKPTGPPPQLSLTLRGTELTGVPAVGSSLARILENEAADIFECPTQQGPACSFAEISQSSLRQSPSPSRQASLWVALASDAHFHGLGIATPMPARCKAARARNTAMECWAAPPRACLSRASPPTVEAGSQRQGASERLWEHQQRMRQKHQPQLQKQAELQQRSSDCSEVDYFGNHGPVVQFARTDETTSNARHQLTLCHDENLGKDPEMSPGQRRRKCMGRAPETPRSSGSASIPGDDDVVAESGDSCITSSNNRAPSPTCDAVALIFSSDDQDGRCGTSDEYTARDKNAKKSQSSEPARGDRVQDLSASAAVSRLDSGCCGSGNPVSSERLSEGLARTSVAQSRCSNCPGEGSQGGDENMHFSRNSSGSDDDSDCCPCAEVDDEGESDDSKSTLPVVVVRSPSDVQSILKRPKCKEPSYDSESDTVQSLSNAYQPLISAGDNAERAPVTNNYSSDEKLSEALRGSPRGESVAAATNTFPIGYKREAAATPLIGTMVRFADERLLGNPVAKKIFYYLTDKPRSLLMKDSNRRRNGVPLTKTRPTSEARGTRCPQEFRVMLHVRKRYMGLEQNGAATTLGRREIVALFSILPSTVRSRVICTGTLLGSPLVVKSTPWAASDEVISGDAHRPAFQTDLEWLDCGCIESDPASPASTTTCAGSPTTTTTSAVGHALDPQLSSQYKFCESSAREVPAPSGQDSCVYSSSGPAAVAISESQTTNPLAVVETVVAPCEDSGLASNTRRDFPPGIRVQPEFDNRVDGVEGDASCEMNARGLPVYESVVERVTVRHQSQGRPDTSTFSSINGRLSAIDSADLPTADCCRGPGPHPAAARRSGAAGFALLVASSEKLVGQQPRDRDDLESDEPSAAVTSSPAAVNVQCPAIRLIQQVTDLARPRNPSALVATAAPAALCLDGGSSAERSITCASNPDVDGSRALGTSGSPPISVPPSRGGLLSRLPGGGGIAGSNDSLARHGPTRSAKPPKCGWAPRCPPDLPRDRPIGRVEVKKLPEQLHQLKRQTISLPHTERWHIPQVVVQEVSVARTAPYQKQHNLPAQQLRPPPPLWERMPHHQQQEQQRYPHAQQQPQGNNCKSAASKQRLPAGQHHLVRESKNDLIEQQQRWAESTRVEWSSVVSPKHQPVERAGVAVAGDCHAQRGEVSSIRRPVEHSSTAQINSLLQHPRRLAQSQRVQSMTPLGRTDGGTSGGNNENVTFPLRLGRNPQSASPTAVSSHGAARTVAGDILRQSPSGAQAATAATTGHGSGSGRNSSSYVALGLGPNPVVSKVLSPAAQLWQAAQRSNDSPSDASVGGFERFSWPEQRKGNGSDRVLLCGEALAGTASARPPAQWSAISLLLPATSRWPLHKPNPHGSEHHFDSTPSSVYQQYRHTGLQTTADQKIASIPTPSMGSVLSEGYFSGCTFPSQRYVVANGRDGVTAASSNGSGRSIGAGACRVGMTSEACKLPSSLPGTEFGVAPTIFRSPKSTQHSSGERIGLPGRPHLQGPSKREAPVLKEPVPQRLEARAVASLRQPA